MPDDVTETETMVIELQSIQNNTNPMVHDISLPEPPTMQRHLGAANPHPQYLQITSMAEAFNMLVGLADMNDVDIDPAITLQDKVLTFDGGTWTAKDVNTIVTQITDATYFDSGIVKLATMTDVTNNVSAAVTPETMVSYVSTYVSNYFGDMHATLNNYGTVRVASRVEDIAAAITDNNVTNLVETVNTSRFVNTHAWSWNETAAQGSMMYYSTHAGPVSNVPEVDDYAGARPTYIVYQDGVLQSHVNTTARNEWTCISSGGNAYDIKTCGEFIVKQNASVKRLEVIPVETIANHDPHYVNAAGDKKYSSTDETINVMINSALQDIIPLITWPDIQGTVHDLRCTPSGWIAARELVGTDNSLDNLVRGKCIVAVTNHGHVEYALVEGTGQIDVHDTGIVEHVVVRNTQSDSFERNHYGLIVGPGGSGYDITLQGTDSEANGVVVSKAYARATIQGYAEDVRVYSGCCLDIQLPTAHVKNLTVYNGGYVMMNQGATIEGLVMYPGATVMTTPDCNVNTLANCHEPDKDVILVDLCSNVFSLVSGKEVAAMYLKPHGREQSTGLSYGEAFLYTSATIVDYVTYDNKSDTRIGANEIDLFTTDSPRGFARINQELVESLNAGLVATSDRIEVLTSAYQYRDLQIVSCFRNSGLTPSRFTVAAPEDMYTDLKDFSEIIKWKIFF